MPLLLSRLKSPLMLRLPIRFWTHALLMSWAVCASAAEVSDPDELWVHHVEPALERNCFKCHGGVRQRSGLDVRSLVNLLKGGKQEAAIAPGSPEESLLYQYVSDGTMPPDEEKQLTPEEIAAIGKWIRALPPLEELIPTGSDRIDWPTNYARALNERREPKWTPPDCSTLSDAIDGFVRHEWERLGINPAGPADDQALVRRLYLDLVGRIPAATEADTVLKSDKPERVAALVEQLLHSPEYARHMREIFDVVLMGRPPKAVSTKLGRPLGERRKDSGWYDYLEHVFSTNRPWDQIVHQLIAARPQSGEERGAVWFLYERQKIERSVFNVRMRTDHQAMAEAVGPVAFGIQVQCAQCHNHPLAWEVEQRHYWGLVAAFIRSQPVETDDGPGMAEAAVGGFVNFSNLKNESQPAVMTFLNGTTIDEQRPEADAKEVDSADLYLVPPPEEKPKRDRQGPRRVEHVSMPIFSRRVKLAEAVTEDNPLLARAFVNRIWAMLMGRGLVHPVDQMDEKHRPSHPDLLDWLAADFEQSGYNVKRLIRGIVLSRTYQLDSRWTTGKAPRPETFAKSLEKPLSAEQLYRSLLIATGNEVDANDQVAGHDAENVLKEFVDRFPDLFPEQYIANVGQGMFLTNSPVVHDLLRPTKSNTAGRLVALEAPSERVEEAYRVVLGRTPIGGELSRLTAYLSGRSPEDSVKQMLWALVTSAEFLVNH